MPAELIRQKGKNFYVRPQNGKNFTREEIERILGTNNLVITKISRFKVLVYDDTQITNDPFYLNTEAEALMLDAGLNIKIYCDAIHCKSTQVYFNHGFK